MSFIVTKKTKTLCCYYQKSERGHAYITQSATGLMPASRRRRGGSRHRGVERVEAGLLYPWKMHQAAESWARWPVNCGGVCEQRTDRCSTCCGTEEQENMLSVLFAKLLGHFQVHAAIFTKLKSFLEEQVKSSTALYSVYLEGIQHRWGTNVSTKPCLPCSCVFTFPFDQSLCYSTWPLFWACLSLLSPGPGLHLYFWHLPHLTLLCFPLRRRKAALLRYQHLGSLLQPFILPR